MRCRVDHQTGHRDRKRRGRKSLRSWNNAAQHGFDMRQQHVKIKGLGDLVIRPQFQAQHLIQFTPSSSEKNHRRADMLAEMAQSIQTIQTGQPDI